MEVVFRTSELAALCNSRTRMVERWGEEGFEAVGRRLGELAALASLSDLPSLPGTQVQIDRRERLVMTFGCCVRVRAVASDGDGVRVIEIASPAATHLEILRIDYIQEERSR